MARSTREVPFANCPSDARERRMEKSIEGMARTPGSGIAMCHAQGKTAVYLSADRTCIVEHPPHGPIMRTPLDDCDRIACGNTLA